MGHEDKDVTDISIEDKEILVDEDEIDEQSDYKEEETDNKVRMTASDVRRKIEAYLERREFIKEIGEEYASLDEFDWV